LGEREVEESERAQGEDAALRDVVLHRHPIAVAEGHRVRQIDHHIGAREQHRRRCQERGADPQAAIGAAELGEQHRDHDQPQE
jgi:hypothetical protein